ncbi:hypothetical protein [Humibacillus xanthopallidus]|nr:hypothetical protein [Humibacillus xanthopallidus]
MSMKTRAMAVTVALIATTGGTALVAGPAHAACPSEILYSLTSTANRMPFSGVPTFKNGPGGTMSVARSYSGSVSFQVTAGAESEVGAVLAKAKVSISASLSTSNSTSTTNTYTRKITSGMYGHAQYVSWGETVSYRKSRVNANCTTSLLATGTIKFPSTSEGWYYWETSS